MKYEVWNEGYSATGESGTAQFLGVHEVDTFKEACKKALIANDWEMEYYNEKTNTYWGCSFYDNETDARKNFG